jgi:CHAD domain-containing protein
VKRKTSALIQAALVAHQACLEAHRGGGTPRDLHRCRVATRRIRVIARTTQPVVGDVLVPLQEELCWLAGVLAPVRDLDVLLDHLGSQVETLDEDGDGAKLVVAALERQRLFRAQEAQDALGSHRFDVLLDRLGAAGSAIPQRGDPLAPIVTRELHKLRRSAANLNGAWSDAEIHALRIRVKRARYTAELLDGAKWKRVGRALARVQDLAGAHQDAVRAEEQLRRLSRPKTAVVVGRLIERERFRKGAQRAALPAALRKALLSRE